MSSDSWIGLHEPISWSRIVGVALQGASMRMGEEGSNKEGRKRVCCEYIAYGLVLNGLSYPHNS